MGKIGFTDADAIAFYQVGERNGLERFAKVDWVVQTSDGSSGEAPTSAPTRDELISKLTENYGRECVEHKLRNGGFLLRRRITASAWADDENAEPALWWVSDHDDAALAAALVTPEVLSEILEARGMRMIEAARLSKLEAVPALRWDNNKHSEAELGAWTLAASALGWSVYIESPLSGRELVADGVTERIDLAANQRAAEAALRAFGVAFRVE